MDKEIKERIYHVKGMHCASCEILIERKLLELEGIKSVEASLAKGRVLIEYEGREPSLERINEVFQKDNYVFSEESQRPKEGFSMGSLLKIVAVSALIIAAFLYLNRSGLSGLVNVSSRSSLPVFFVLGLIAGVSSCAALVGGMVLSLSKQWLDIYSGRQSTLENSSRI
jgi:copper chaperone CopZ